MLYQRTAISFVEMQIEDKICWLLVAFLHRQFELE
jgi:hypothetical protein